MQVAVCNQYPKPRNLDMDLVLMEGCKNSGEVAYSIVAVSSCLASCVTDLQQPEDLRATIL